MRQSQMQLGRHWGTHWELGNTLRTHWELNGKTVKTWWKQQKSNTIVAIPHWVIKIYICTWVHHLFWPILMAGAWICDDIETWVRFDKLKVFHSQSKNSWMSTQAWHRCCSDWPKCMTCDLSVLRLTYSFGDEYLFYLVNLKNNWVDCG
jgi:hypothetical protein